MNTMGKLGIISGLVLVFLASGIVSSEGKNNTTLTLFDFEDGKTSWAILQGGKSTGGTTITTDTPDKSRYALELNSPPNCVIVGNFDRSAWSRAAIICKEDDILQISFWIKGDNKFSDMALVLIEENGNQWIGTVSRADSEPVISEWTEIVRVIKNPEMQTDFYYQPNSGKGETAGKLNVGKMASFQLTNYTENERHVIVDKMELRVIKMGE